MARKIQNSKLVLVVAGLAVLSASAALKVGHLRSHDRDSVPAVKYDLRTTDGAPLASIFEGAAVSKLPIEVVKRLMAEAEASPPDCRKKAKSALSMLWDRIAPDRVFAQTDCTSSCSAHYADTQSVNNPSCPNLMVCGAGGDWTSGCEGYDWSCDPYPGSQCGQVNCTNWGY
jgi:hypothetical protein